MKTGGGAYIPTPSSQEIDDALQDQTDVEMQFVCDSDSVLDESQCNLCYFSPWRVISSLEINKF